MLYNILRNHYPLHIYSNCRISESLFVLLCKVLLFNEGLPDLKLIDWFILEQCEARGKHAHVAEYVVPIAHSCMRDCHGERADKVLLTRRAPVLPLSAVPVRLDHARRMHVPCASTARARAEHAARSALRWAAAH